MKNFILSALLGILSCLLFQNEGYSQSSYKKDFPILSDLYRFDKEHVDYIVVIDQSGSVRPYWAEIKSAIINIINLSKDGDYVTVIGFHSSSDYLVLPRSINSKVKQELIAEINNLPLPNGSYTDLFESVDKTLESINRPNGNNLQAIFYFTDFKNSPPSTTRWNHQNISLLDNKYSNYILKANKLVNIFAFQLPIDNQAGMDYELFNRIFGQTVFKILVNTGSLDEWFVRLEDQLNSQRLKLKVKSDLKDFIVLKSVSTDHEQIKLTVENRLPFVAFLKKVDIKSGSASEIITESFSNFHGIARGQTDIYISAKTFLQKYPTIFERTIPIEKPDFTLDLSFSDLQTELAKLNIDQSTTRNLLCLETLSLKSGIPYWELALVGILVLLLCVQIYKYWIKPEWTFNQKGFKVTVALDGKLLPNSGRVFEKSKKPIIIDHNVINSSDVSSEIARIVSESQFKIIVVPTKPRIFGRNPKRGTYLFAEAKGISFKVKKLVKSKVQFASLPTNRRLYAERVFLHKGVTISGEITVGITRVQLEFNFYNK